MRPFYGSGDEQMSGMRLYMAFDERAADGDTEDATCLQALGNFEDMNAALLAAIKSLGSRMPFVLYSYARNGSDERMETHHVVTRRKK